METFRLNIKNMVCPRCIMAVEETLRDLGIAFTEVKLGEVNLTKELGTEELLVLETKLKQLGFELLNDKNLQLVERIKNEIIQLVHYQDNPDKMGHLSKQLPSLIGQSYTSLSKLFSESEGITIERYLILQKIERAKELLSYGELNVSEIALQLNYSSSQHFSRQFSGIVGFSPTVYAKNEKKDRSPIHRIHKD
ncbi:AraC family transcriptional regulator [Ancylomarina longa]|uniref:AraC family transcriptional regulator n=1 Tax=Ancylomarina longa TaxID=2487017 RepID=A0A434AYH0_9BACT|nr:AraC family transcriptional regulator [Ancylomarina longa]RUT79611.1 AraC family transcriptional regulator [Ancylomarina longa]